MIVHAQHDRAEQWMQISAQGHSQNFFKGSNSSIELLEVGVWCR